MLGAGVNTLPPALLFLALGALAFALAPRASTVIAYGLVGLAFVWELFGALLEVPDWLLALSSFHDVGLVPASPSRPPRPRSCSRAPPSRRSPPCGRSGSRT
jgi:putative exporter of polyketide antibiotics